MRQLPPRWRPKVEQADRNRQSCYSCKAIFSASVKKLYCSYSCNIAYYEANRRAPRAAVSTWWKDYPERYRVMHARQQSKRRARLRESKKIGNVSIAQWEWIKYAQGYCCWWCGNYCGKSLHVDHIVPLARGGFHILDNLIGSCARCNRKKHANYWPKEDGILYGKTSREF